MIFQVQPSTAQYSPAQPLPARLPAATSRRRRRPWVVVGFVVVTAAAIAGVLATRAQDEPAEEAVAEPALTEGADALTGAADDSDGADLAGSAGAPIGSASAPIGAVVPIGDTGRSGQFEATVLQVTDPWQSELGIEFAKPGSRLLAVEMEIVNVGDAPESFSNFTGLQLEDSTGARHGIALYGLDLPDLNGDLAPGESMRGWQVFEIPETADGLTLLVKGSILSEPATFAL